jgi:hypothetical protein
MIRPSFFLPRVLCASVFAISVGALAQASTQHRPMTRERAECELRELESVGYSPWEEDYYYPRNLEIAQARLAAMKRAQGLEGVDTCAGGGASAPASGKAP